MHKDKKNFYSAIKEASKRSMVWKISIELDIIFSIFLNKGDFFLFFASQTY